MFSEYYHTFIFIFIVALISTIFVLVSLLLAKTVSKQKTTKKTFECGFPSTNASEQRFEFKYFTAILIAFCLLTLSCLLFPYILIFSSMGFKGFFVLFLLFIFSGLGLFYAFKKGFLL